MEVALLRAQRMTLYAEPELADPAAIDELVNDNILTKQSNELKYAPSHDILEDWALVKHIRRLRETHHEPEAFYQNIGNKPALRRAFRLWVEDSLRNRAATVFELIRETRQQAFIEPYWADEVLVAILRSDESLIFFEEFKTELLEGQAQFLQRTIHLLRTACKEHQTSHTHKLLYPVGSGWMATLSFIHLYLARLGSLRILITSLLIDWSYSLYKDSERLSTREVGAVKGILFTYLEEIENQEEKAWQEEPLKNRVKSLLDVTFELTEYAKSEVQALLERAIPKPTDRYDYHDKSFYGRIRKMTLSGIYCRPLTKFLPEQVIAMAKATWIKKPRLKTSEHSKNLSPILRILEQQQEEDDYYSFDKNRQFGFENHIDDSPSGIFKTPVYNLLLNHWQRGTDFLLEIVNHCTNYYVKSREARGDEIAEVQLQLLDGQLVNQSGSHVLWQAYRGTVVSSYLLESLLMSLEAYLLKIVEAKTEVSRQNIQLLFDYLLHGSETVAISSVLVSVAIAYPQEVGEAMLPLLGVREFYEWDVHRALDDQINTLALWDDEISFAQTKRHELNELPHRKKYGYGLKGFVLDLQLNLKLFNEAFFSVLDRMWEEADEQDIYWRKTLHEIDARKWQITEHKSELGGFIIEPAYEPTVQKLVDDFLPERESHEQAAVAAIWIGKIYDRKDGAIADYALWSKTFEKYKVNESFNFIHDRPVSLAVIGVRELNQELNIEQRTWCFETITGAINRLIVRTKHRDAYLEDGPPGSIFDRDAALTALPLLLKTTNDLKKRERIIKLLLQALTSFFHRIEMDPLLASLREQLWEADATVANQVWQGLIRFAQLRKSQEKDQWRAYQNEELQKQIEKTESEFIRNVITGEENEAVDFQEIRLVNWHSQVLTRALIMLPFNTEQEDHIKYRKFFIPLFLKGLDKDFEREERIDRRPLIYDDDRISLQKHLQDFFLYCDNENAADIAELLLHRASQILSST
ncbi:hypothetical protein [Spirosoma spitsbergense]|uniref:hypothetical protein n=1 Tax=Spirosoma spitsbergense TaxID=431554 RepID=UPI0012F81B6A|nr:hypothetical protein [Spirosoma spitsbergense]